MQFKELTDEQLEYIKQLLPGPMVTGRPRADEGGELIGYDAHKRIKCTKIHAVVNERSARIKVAIGRGD